MEEEFRPFAEVKTLITPCENAPLQVSFVHLKPAEVKVCKSYLQNVPKSLKNRKTPKFYVFMLQLKMSD